MKSAALDAAYAGDPLTEIELEVLKLAANGFNCAETAAQRERSWETVRTQRRLILAKLQAPNMTAAVAHALREGLID